MEVSPCNGIIYEDPQFLDQEHLDFQLSELSPCINSGNPNIYLDSDGSYSDIGSNPFLQNNNCTNLGDLNIDDNIDVLDIVILSSCIIFDENCSTCFDVNQDNEINVLDIINIVNLIIN